jgi:hypothetical protein
MVRDNSLALATVSDIWFANRHYPVPRDTPCSSLCWAAICALCWRHSVPYQLVGYTKNPRGWEQGSTISQKSPCSFQRMGV